MAICRPIKVEPSITVDPRFRALARLVGENKALGMCIHFWHLAGHYWAKGQALVPESLIKIDGLAPLIEVDLAERREGGIYARGSTKHFACKSSKRG